MSNRTNLLGLPLLLLFLAASGCTEAPLAITAGYYSGTLTMTIGEDAEVRTADTAVLEVGRGELKDDVDMVFELSLVDARGTRADRSISLYLHSAADAAILANDLRGYAEFDDLALDTESVLATEDSGELYVRLSGHVRGGRDGAACAQAGLPFSAVVQAGPSVVRPRQSE